jgi:pimeloyl-ACP methyl ester carboxylesterase
MKGEGYPILFLHGYLGSIKTHWKYQLTDLALSSSYNLIGLDFRGFGRSATETRNIQKTSEIIKDIRILLTRELQLLSSPILVGYSVGATFALLYSLVFQQDVKALVLLSPMPSFPREIRSRNLKSTRNNTSRIINLILTNAWGLLKKVNLTVRSRQIKRYMNSPPPIMMNLKQLQMPILMVYGENDTIIPRLGYEILKRYLPSHSKIVSLPADHGISHENPREFNRILLHFLKLIL